MLLHKILLSLSLLAFPAMAAQAVRTGEWEDGSAVAWMCSSNANVAVKFAFKTKEGQVYQGVMSCGDTI